MLGMLDGNRGAHDPRAHDANRPNRPRGVRPNNLPAILAAKRRHAANVFKCRGNSGLDHWFGIGHEIWDLEPAA